MLKNSRLVKLERPLDSNMIGRCYVKVQEENGVDNGGRAVETQD